MRETHHVLLSEQIMVLLARQVSSEVLSRPTSAYKSMNHIRASLRIWVVIVALALSVPGCGPRTSARHAGPPASDAAATIDQVCKIAAELMGVDRSRIDAETSLSHLGADDLDFVELVMELEEHFDVFIPDETAEEMMGTDNWQQGMKNVTMSKLADLIDELRLASRGDAEQAHAREPAAGSVSDGESSPPAR